jgi:hypothetical protein
MWSAVACYRLRRRKQSLRTPRKPVPVARDTVRAFGDTIRYFLYREE